jgi:hypothetical protein
MFVTFSTQNVLETAEFHQPIIFILGSDAAWIPLIAFYLRDFLCLVILEMAPCWRPLALPKCLYTKRRNDLHATGYTTYTLGLGGLITMTAVCYRCMCVVHETGCVEDHETTHSLPTAEFRAFGHECNIYGQLDMCPLVTV